MSQNKDLLDKVFDAWVDMSERLSKGIIISENPTDVLSDREVDDLIETFGEGDQKGREKMAEYIQKTLQKKASRLVSEVKANRNIGHVISDQKSQITDNVQVIRRFLSLSIKTFGRIVDNEEASGTSTVQTLLYSGGSFNIKRTVSAASLFGMHRTILSASFDLVKALDQDSPGRPEGKIKHKEKRMKLLLEKDDGGRATKASKAWLSSIGKIALTYEKKWGIETVLPAVLGKQIAGDIGAYTLAKASRRLFSLDMHSLVRKRINRRIE